MMIRCQNCRVQLEVTARFCGSCGSEIVDENIGRVIANRYALKERVGSGSIGIVYRAEQLGLGRKVAIKLLPAHIESDPLLTERFRREGALLCQLKSPHTVTTYEFDRDADGTLYIAMELSMGRNLAEAIRKERSLEWRRVLKILAGLCDSLGEAHGLGVVHRDLRPENILLEERKANPDFVKVLDFGLAKLMYLDLTLSPTGQTVGAVEYMSPEQLLSKPLDGRSDLYSLGVLAYQMLSGQHPFSHARTYGHMVSAHVQTVPTSIATLVPDLPVDVEEIVSRCLEKEPNRRFPDAGALAAVITVVLSMPNVLSGDTIQTPEGEEDTALAPIPTPVPKR